MAIAAEVKRASFAADPARSRGRLFPEEETASRNAFRRDCDRIIHSTAFRRLKHKTQVFVSSEGDHFRTRLTHTLEVAAEICDRVGIFNRGKLVALGSPAELTAQAASGKLEDIFLQVTGPGATDEEADPTSS